ncbi:MAG: molybdate ABC transporter substrate-binding protein [Ignavibacteria bacterium]|nr:molybdate ABC transporter substrate-binding protein [Ignavibacteria bacterium]
MRRLIVFCILLVSISLVNLFGQKITVAAAADLRFALPEIVSSFNKTDSTIKVECVFGASGNLFQQIVNGAPFDIYFAADNSFTKMLTEKKLTVAEPKLYAIGHLVLWSAKKDISKGVWSLVSDDVKKIAIANPKTAPYGKRAVECMSYYKIDKTLADKIVTGDNVAQAAQFVVTGNADAGFIALSMAIAPDMKNKGTFIELDPKSYTPLEQTYVVLGKSKEIKAINTFLHFFESQQGKDILKKYGFTLPSGK